jgi:hypothetical protein
MSIFKIFEIFPPPHLLFFQKIWNLGEFGDGACECANVPEIQFIKGFQEFTNIQTPFPVSRKMETPLLWRG